MNLVELWDLFDEISSEDALEGQLTNIIISFLKEKTLFIFNLICYILEKYHTIGNLRSYSKQELLDVFPWQRSQLQVLLRKARNQDIVISQKRKYSLNLEHPLVKRLWNYYFTPEGQKVHLYDNIMNTTCLYKEKSVLENEINSLRKKTDECNKSIIEDDFQEFKKEMQFILDDVGIEKISIMKLCKKEISSLIKFNLKI